LANPVSFEPELQYGRPQVLRVPQRVNSNPMPALARFKQRYAHNCLQCPSRSNACAVKSQIATDRHSSNVRPPSLFAKDENRPGVSRLHEIDFFRMNIGRAE
jgi:hypothetical protein